MGGVRGLRCSGDLFCPGGPQIERKWGILIPLNSVPILKINPDKRPGIEGLHKGNHRTEGAGSLSSQYDIPVPLAPPWPLWVGLWRLNPTIPDA